MIDPFVILAVVLLLPVIGLLTFLGCASFSGTDNTPPVSIKKDMTLPSLGPGETHPFTATTDDSSAIAWSATLGTLDSSGVYTAPLPFDNSKTAPVSVTVTATKQNNVKESDTTTLNLINATLALSVNPMPAILKPGGAVVLTASTQHTPDVKFLWTGVTPDAPSGPKVTYTAPTPYVLGSGPINVNVVSDADSTARAGTTITLIGNGAKFLKKDTTTQGGWARVTGNVYGKDGYALANSPTNVVNAPLYLDLNTVVSTPSPGGSLKEQTYAPKGDARDLTDPANLSKVIAAVWYTNVPGFKQYQFDIQFTDFQTHQMAVYCAIWDGQPRSQIVSILDGDNANPLDTQKLAGFDTGVYLVWNVSGHITLQVTNDPNDSTSTPPNIASPNATISGIFFG